MIGRLVPSQQPIFQPLTECNSTDPFHTQQLTSVHMLGKADLRLGCAQKFHQFHL